MDCLKYFNFVSLSALRCLLVFPFVLGLQRWESFLISARSFFYFFLRSFQLSFFFTSYLLFSFRIALRYPVAFCNSLCFGIAKVRIFFHSRKKYFYFFSRLFFTSLLLRFALFSVFKAALRCLVFLPALSVWDCKGETFFAPCQEVFILFWNFKVAALFISALFFSADQPPPQFRFVHIKVKHFLTPCQGFFWILYTK